MFEMAEKFKTRGDQEERDLKRFLKFLSFKVKIRLRINLKKFGESKCVVLFSRSYVAFVIPHTKCPSVDIGKATNILTLSLCNQ